MLFFVKLIYGIMEIPCFKLRNYGNSVFKITELWKFRVQFRNLALIHLNYGKNNYGNSVISYSVTSVSVCYGFRNLGMAIS